MKIKSKKKSDKNNNSNSNNNNNNNLDNTITANVNNNDDLNGYEQFFHLFKSKGFEKISIYEISSEKYLSSPEGAELLKPNELTEIEQVFNSGGRSINIFIGGQRFFINSSSEVFLQASNNNNGLVLHRTKTKYIIAIYDLKQLSNLDVAFSFADVMEPIYSFNKEDFITNLL